MPAAAIGAIVGLLVGIGLSVYVGMIDLRKRQEGTRARAHYRGSPFLVPAILAGLGALIGWAVGAVL